jgi:hypothetical protein
VLCFFSSKERDIPRQTDRDFYDTASTKDRGYAFCRRYVFSGASSDGWCSRYFK